MSTPPEVLAQLQTLLERSYSPYSGYAVAAVVRAKSGKLYGGTNMENAAYPLSRCAEQGAVLAMVAAGEREITEVWVMVAAARPGTPCGGCRQILSEFARPETPVHCLNHQGQGLTLSVGGLLPHAFGPLDLNRH
ncbi:MAG: cytidine deaminase [Thermaceae bacterium]|nr:cytidine deaminase [Thermaceae bacterium]